MPNNHIQVHFGFIAVATTLFFGHMVTAQFGTNGLIVAYKATDLCYSIENQPDYKQKDLETCLHSILEPAVWVVVKNYDLNLKNCKADMKEESTRAWCTVWIYFWPRYIMITNKRLVEYIRMPMSNKPPVPREEDEVLYATTTVPPPPPTQMQIPSVNEFVKHKVKEVRGGMLDSVVDGIEKVEDVKEVVYSKAKTHAERANRLADDLRGRAEETARQAVDSVKDLRGRLKSTWGDKVRGG